MKRYAPGWLIMFLGFLLLSAPGRAWSIQISFMGRLANFEGIVPSMWSMIAVDKERKEVFTLNPRQRNIRIYNEIGMETFSFGDNVELAGATDIDLGEEGNIYLVYPRAEKYKILRLDYKGEPLAFVDLKEFPADFQGFSPDRLQFIDGMLYLADTVAMDVAVIDIEGVFQQGFHLKTELEKLGEEFRGRPGDESLNDPQRFKYIDMMGFCADREGNLYFTIPVLFSAFKYTNTGELKMFGSAGSAPGKFGVVAGINTDRQGNIFITDRLRSVVMIFDRKFNFLTEFGYRGLRPGNLIVPDDVIVDDNNGLIYVAQAANRGVNVYRIKEDSQASSPGYD